jgi:hypothetical protein
MGLTPRKPILGEVFRIHGSGSKVELKLFGMRAAMRSTGRIER